MKKLFMMLATAGMLLVSSCAKEDISANAWGEGEEVLVTFTTAVPGVATRAEATYGNGDSAERLVYCVFDENWTAVGDGQVEIADAFAGNNLETTVTMRLVSGKTYNFIFWADANEGYYTFNDLTNIKVNGAFVGNDESRDAFYATIKGLYVNGTVNKPVELRRPFAQLNMLTADLEVAKKMGYDLTKTEVVAPMYTAFDLVAEEVTGAATEITFAMNDRAENTYEINGIDYEFIAMNYLLVPADETQISCTLKSDNGYKQEFHTVPVERNHRTNLYGNLLTDPANFLIKINPDFENDNHERWDGVTMNKSAVDANGAYLISNASAMAWVLKNHSKDAALKLVLECDIDFGGFQLPHNADKTYSKIDFEGNGHVIRNYISTVTGTRAATEGSIQALFPNAITANIRELTIEGAYVDAGEGESAYAGILLGRTYGTIKLTNVTVKDSELKGTNKLGAMVGFVAENNIMAEYCRVIDTDVTTHNVANESGLAGGFIGYIASGDNVFNYCSVEGGSFRLRNSRKNAERANSVFIGAVGSGTVTLVGCSAEPDYFTQPGGIYNSATGETYASPYGPYNTTGDMQTLIGGNRGAAKVTIDGNEIITPAAAADAMTQEGAVIELHAGTYTIPADVADNVTIIADDYVTFNMGGTSLAVNGLTIDGGVIAGNNTTSQTTLTINGNNNTIRNVEFTYTGGNGVALDINDTDQNSVTVVEGIDFGTEDSFRNIGWCQLRGTLHVKDCKFTDGIYNVHIDSGNNTAELIVENSTLYGLTTLGDSLKKATFINCEMGFVNGYNAFWLRSDADFINCRFAKKDDANGYAANGYGITAAVANEKNVVNFTGCTYTDGSAINYVDTTSEIAPLINEDEDSESWIWKADGVLVAGNATVVDEQTPVSDINDTLADGGNLVLGGDVEIEKSEGTTNGYGATGLSQTNGGVIDGNGNEVSIDAWSTWDSAINTTGGTIRNVKITSGMRGIFINHNSDYSSKVYLENVIIDGTIYTISCDQGSNKGLEATDCVFNGWTSYAATLGDVKFTNCSFGEGQGYKFMRPYAPTTLINCDFCEGYRVDARAKTTFINCTINGVKLTSENLSTLVTSNIANAVVE